MSQPNIRKSRKQFRSNLPNDPVGITYVQTRTVLAQRVDTEPHPGRVFRSGHFPIGDPVGITYVKTRVIAGHKVDEFPFPGRVTRSLQRNPEVSAEVLPLQRRNLRGDLLNAPPHEGKVRRSLRWQDQEGVLQRHRFAAGWQFPFDGRTKRARLPGDILDIYQLQRSRKATAGQQDDLPGILLSGRTWRGKTPGVDIFIDWRRQESRKVDDSEPLLFAGRTNRTKLPREGEARIVADLRSRLATTPGIEPGLGGKSSRRRVPGDGSLSLPLAVPRRIAAGFSLAEPGQARRASMPPTGQEEVPALPIRRVAQGETMAYPGRTVRRLAKDGTEGIQARRVAYPVPFEPFAGRTTRTWIMAYQDVIYPHRTAAGDNLLPFLGAVRRGPVIFQPPFLIVRRAAWANLVDAEPFAGRAWRSVSWDVELAPALRRIAAGQTVPYEGRVVRLWLPGSAEAAVDLIQQRRAVVQVLELPPEPGQSRRGLLLGLGEVGADRLALRRTSNDPLGGVVEAAQWGHASRAIVPSIVTGTALLKADAWIVEDRGLVWDYPDISTVWDEGDRNTVWEVDMSSPIAHTKIKYLSENRLYAFDFTRAKEIVDGETLTGTPTVTADVSGLTIGSTSISGAEVRFRLSVGTADTAFTLRCTVATSGGSTLISEGALRVIA